MNIEKKERTAPDWVKSPKGIIDIYANSSHLTWSLDDVRVRLGQIIDSPETPTPGPVFKGVIEERAAVTFSWRGAKMLCNQLQSLVDSFEAINGPIKIDLKLPPSM